MAKWTDDDGNEWVVEMDVLDVKVLREHADIKITDPKELAAVL